MGDRREGQTAQLQIGQGTESRREDWTGKGIGVALSEGVRLICGTPPEMISPY